MFVTLREACGLGQRELGAWLGVSLGAVQLWEAGSRPIPDERALKLMELDDMIRDGASMALKPIFETRPDVPVTLVRYKTDAAYARTQFAADLPRSSHTAMLWRIVDGLKRLDHECAMVWADEPAVKE